MKMWKGGQDPLEEGSLPGQRSHSYHQEKDISRMCVVCPDVWHRVLAPSQETSEECEHIPLREHTNYPGHS